MRLYKLVNVTWEDPWGEKNKNVRQIVAVREVSLHEDTVTIDDGYGVYEGRVFEDSHGRKYEDRTDRISYSPPSFFVERETGDYWTARPTGKVLDLYGNPWRGNNASRNH